MSWQKLTRSNFRFTAFEVFYSEEDQGKYFVKIFFFKTVIMISGDAETVTRKLEEIEGACVKARAFIKQNEFELEKEKGGTV